jgi:hypothetical protein
MCVGGRGRERKRGEKEGRGGERGVILGFCSTGTFGMRERDGDKEEERDRRR